MRSDSRRLDAALAAVLVIIGEVGIWTGAAKQGPKPLAACVVLAIAGVLAVRRTAPVVLGATLCVASITQAVFGGHPVNTFFDLLVLLILGYSIGRHAEGRRFQMALALLVVGVYASQFADPNSDVIDTVFGPPILAGAPALAGWLVRRGRRQTEELAALNAELEARREADVARALDDERARIARELHDVIAHSISIMVVQAGAAEQVVGDGPGLEALHSIRRTGKSALAEMRRLLDVLRADPGLQPQPGVAELPAMVDRMRAAGVDVALEVDPALPALQPGPDLVVYRVVQEALTNTLKHAGPTSARIHVRYDGSAMEIEATDSGGAGTTGRGAGHGLVGMRERLALYDGDLASGPSGTGWRLRARLPVGPETLQ